MEKREGKKCKQICEKNKTVLGKALDIFRVLREETTSKLTFLSYCLSIL